MADSVRSYQDAVQQHLNHLYDVVALLDAAIDRIEAHAPCIRENERLHNDMHNTMRLVQMAQERVDSATQSMANCV